MTDEFEQAFGQWIDGATYDQAEETLFQLLRGAFLAGWKAAPTVSHSGATGRTPPSRGGSVWRKPSSVGHGCARCANGGARSKCTARSVHA